MAEHIEPETLSHHVINSKQHFEAKLEALLKENASQFVQDETSVGTTPLTEMMIDTAISEPLNPTPLPWNTTKGSRMK